jgi:hypothetical protein
VSVFRRRKSQDVDAEVGEHSEDEAVASGPDEAADEVPPEAARPEGPWDVDDVPDDDDRVRLDLGSIRLPGFEGMEIQVNVAEGGSEVIAVTAVAGDAALQLQPFAAPRREGIWAEIRAELAAQIAGDGGSVEEVEGPFGPELRARVPVPQPPGQAAPHGQGGLTPARFVGVDGPRWFLRGVLTGRAAVDAEAARQLEDVFRGTVVVRGGDPRAPREPLPLRLPDSAPPPAAEEPPARPPLDLGTGQQITEIR